MEYGNGLANDVMNHVDCVIKRDVFPQKMHSCYKYIRGISIFVSRNIRGISKEIYHRRHCIGILLVER